MDTTYTSLTHLASLVFSTAVLITQPEFAKIVIFIAGFNMAFALASVMSLGHCYLTGRFPPLAQPPSSLVSTHCGGMVCYVITIGYAFEFSMV